MRHRTSTTGTKTSARRKDSTARIVNDRKWDGSAGRRPNRLTECIVGDVGRWLGNCAQDRRLWLRENCARELTRPWAVAAHLVCAERGRVKQKSLGTQARGSR